MPRGGALRASFSRPTGGFMTAITDWIQDNWKAIECTTYSSLGLGAYGAAWASVFTPAPVTALGWTAIGGAFELAYNLAGCNDGPITPPPEGNGCPGLCWKATRPRNMFVYQSGDGFPPFPQAYSVDEVVSVTWNGMFQHWEVKYITATEGELIHTVGLPKTAIICVSLIGGGECVKQSPDTVPPPHEPDEPIGPPTIHQDEECVWTITPIDAYVDASGVAHIYYRAEPNDEACGEPYEFWSSDKGPRFVQPNPDEPGPTPPPEYKPDPEPVTPDCPDPCKDYDAEFAAIMAKLQEIQECACKDNEKVALEGDWVTTQWQSDEPPDGSKSRLRKRFRYRSKSSRNLEQLSSYWRDFTWQAGQVCVIHKGTWWGTPQVWASSAEEGKRIIRFAGAEAGLDPDQVGEWVVSGSRTPRIGMFGTMRIRCYRGTAWVASRDGSDRPNYLAT